MGWHSTTSEPHDAVVCRLPLGVPASLFMEALELAQAFIGNPTSARATGVAVEREAGYILLGALCMCLPAEVLKVPLYASDITASFVRSSFGCPVLG